MLRWSLTSLVEPSNLQLEEIYTQNFNLLSADIRKWSNTLKKSVGKFRTNCLSVFDHFVGLALKGLKIDSKNGVFTLFNQIICLKSQFLNTYSLLLAIYPVISNQHLKASNTLFCGAEESAMIL